MPDSPYALFDDNPSVVDLLGLSPLASAVAKATMDPDLDPVTIGIDSPWGGGKSTALNLIESELNSEDGALVVRIDPWEFVDSGDPRGTLITRVLDGLHREYTARCAGLPDDDVRARAASALTALGEKVLSLKRRISWAKVAQVAVKSAISLTPDIVGLVDALTPGPEKARDDAELGMREFRQEFETLVQSLPTVTRVVILVDDLDRCLPSDVLGTFEAIKLFLSVRGVAFVIAADEQFIRDALKDALNRREGTTFADRYTEKVIQLPFTLPQLTIAMAESYVGLLLASREPECTPDLLRNVVAAAQDRRTQGVRPYLYESMEQGFPSRKVVHRATSIVRGMPTSVSSTPRQLKRFLNNFAIRGRLLNAVGSDLNPEVIMKLWILEQNHFAEFRELAALSSHDRGVRLQQWQSGGTGSNIDSWAADGIDLTETLDQVTSYLSLASAVITDIHIGVELSLDQAQLLGALLSESDLVRKEAQNEVAGGDAEYSEVITNLVVSILGPRREQSLDSILQIGIRREDLNSSISEALLRPDILPAIDRFDLPWLSPFPAVLSQLRVLHADDRRFIESLDDSQIDI